MRYFLDVPVGMIQESHAYPDRDRRHIYGHLRYFLSHPSPYPLPAVEVLISGESGFVIMRGHKYLRIAQELGRRKIRAIVNIDAKSVADVIADLRADVSVVSREVLEHEVGVSVEWQWQVYFFANPLDEAAQEQFSQQIVGFFLRLQSALLESAPQRVRELSFPFGGLCAEFEALIPAADPSWVADYLATARLFSVQTRQIASFQGAVFPL